MFKMFGKIFRCCLFCKLGNLYFREIVILNIEGGQLLFNFDFYVKYDVLFFNILGFVVMKFINIFVLFL